MSKNSARKKRLHITKVTAKAERLGFDIPEEVRKELRMPKVETPK